MTVEFGTLLFGVMTPNALSRWRDDINKGKGWDRTPPGVLMLVVDEQRLDEADSSDEALFALFYF